MVKPKRKNLSKLELFEKIKKTADFKKKMDFTKNKFWPALVAATHNVDDAQTFIGSLSTMIMQKFLNLMKEKKFKDIGLGEIIDPANEKVTELKALLALFDDMNVFDARDLFEGMKNELNLFINDEMRTRPLSSLKTKWADEVKLLTENK